MVIWPMKTYSTIVVDTCSIHLCCVSAEIQTVLRCHHQRSPSQIPLVGWMGFGTAPHLRPGVLFGTDHTTLFGPGEHMHTQTRTVSGRAC